MEKELRALKENFEQLKADAEITLESNYKTKVNGIFTRRRSHLKGL